MISAGVWSSRNSRETLTRSEYASAFHCENLSPRIGVIFILYFMAEELVSEVAPNGTKFLLAVGVHLP